jgi:GTP-binding protein
VGVVEYEDYVQISIADLPGLLPDTTRGLGIGFLRHLERCRIILLVIDLSADDPVKHYNDIENIINVYNGGILSTKPFIVIGNKIDLEKAIENLPKFKEKINKPVITISTVDKINITKFLLYLRDIYNKIEK